MRAWIFSDLHLDRWGSILPLAVRDADVWALEDASEEPTVVVTHHAPCWRSAPSALTDDNFSDGVLSEVEGGIVRHRPLVWVHGHYHNRSENHFLDTRVICNPLGYPHSPVPISTRVLLSISKRRNRVGIYPEERQRKSREATGSTRSHPPLHSLARHQPNPGRGRNAGFTATSFPTRFRC